MTEGVANAIVLFLAAYAGVGLLIAFIYAFGGAGRIDPAARGKGLPIQARLLIMPGVLGLWPLMLSKLFRQKEPPVL